MSTLDGMSELDDSRPTLQQAASPVIPRLTRRETLLDISSIFAWVLATDLLLYHSGGYAAWGVFVLIAAAVMLLARRKLGAAPYTLTVCGLMILVQRVVCASPGAVQFRAVAERHWADRRSVDVYQWCTPPYLPDMISLLFACTWLAAAFGLSRFSLQWSQYRAWAQSASSLWGAMLPLIVIVAFSYDLHSRQSGRLSLDRFPVAQCFANRRPMVKQPGSEAVGVLDD